ncbi:MAG: hypothetical protein M0008_10190 [Actinomycetota bacterium]|jgi:hypothetical protein|nr:hypothetical protein [Actinomycetota bacterium]
MKPPYENPMGNVAIFEAMFDAEHLDWALIGGLAAIEHRAGHRETVDVDFVVSGIADLERRLAQMEPAKLRVLKERDGAPYLIQGETSDGMHFDIYVATIDFEDAVLATKDENHVASVEAVILYKMMAMRPQDVDDIRSILDAHPDFGGLDLEFIEHWANELDVLDRWNELSAETRQTGRWRRPPRPAVPQPERSRTTRASGYSRKRGIDSLGRPYARWIRQTWGSVQHRPQVGTEDDEQARAARHNATAGVLRAAIAGMTRSILGSMMEAQVTSLGPGWPSFSDLQDTIFAAFSQ